MPLYSVVQSKVSGNIPIMCSVLENLILLEKNFEVLIYLTIKND